VTVNTQPSPNGFAAIAARPVADAGIEIVRDIERFEELACPWRELFQRAGAPAQLFQRFEFLRLWARHYLDAGARLHIVALHRGGRLAAVVPLVKQRHLGVELARLMGAPIAQFDDAIVEPELPLAELENLRQAVAACGADCLLFRRVRTDAALRYLLPAGGFAFEPLQAPFAALAERVDGEDPGPAYSSRERSNYRRRLRRLAEAGLVRAGESGADGPRLAAEAVAMKRAWLDAQGLSSPTVSDARFAAFFADAAADPLSGLRITSIDLDGKPIAIDLSFDCKGRSFGHVIATNPTFEREGIGQLLIHRVFGAAKARGNAAFELMAPQDEYKLRHSDGATAVESIAVPLSPLGHVVGRAAFRYGLPMAKALRGALPEKLIRRLL